MKRFHSFPKWRRCLALLLGGLILLGAFLYLWLFWDLPAPGDLERYATAPSSKIYDRHGRLLYEMPAPYTGSHTPVPLSEIPPALRHATIATEDRNFYHHPGFDVVGIARAVWYNLRYDDVLVGGSTITQQLVRNLMFSYEERTERTLRRKLRELVLAIRITERYSKDEILTFYLNEIYYGHMAYGVEAAAQAYYGKGVRELDLAESAMLAGLPQYPALYNPLEHPEEAQQRQSQVLRLMVEAGYLTAEDAERAEAEPLSFVAAPFPIRAPHFVMYVRGLLEEELGLQRLEAGGLEIYTTLDLDLNDAVRDRMRDRLERLSRCDGALPCQPGGHNARNAALVALHPESGEVLAMVGSPDYFDPQIDGAVNATLALRQPGSAIKPVTYAAAFETGEFTPATMVLDVRTAFKTREGIPYVPLNYDLTFRGPVRVREALGSSYNLVAVKVLDEIGLERMTDLARRLGIRTFDDPGRLGLAVTLGGGEVRLLELTAAYAAFANGGRAVGPVTVLRVEDAEGDVLWTPHPGRDVQVLDPRVAYLVTDVLADDAARIPAFGEGSLLRLSRPAAVKTGTTTDFRDNWTVGYTPDLVVGVWVGNADNEPMRNVTGITGAAPLWHDVMEMAHVGLPERAFHRPEGLVEVEVCALSGLRPSTACPHRVTELFVAGTAPRESCTMHQRAGDTLYTVLPPEAHAWAREHGLPEPPEPIIDQARLLLTAPDQGSVYRIDPGLPRSAQRIAVAAESGVALSELVLRVNGEPWAHFTAPPYRAMWPLEPGEYIFTAEGTTPEGKKIESESVNVRVE